MILLITLGCLLALLGWLLITPVELIIHSTTNEYKLKWGWLLSARLIPLADDLLIRVGLPFFHKDFFPLHPKTKRPSAAKRKKNRQPARKRTSGSSRKTFKLVRAVLKSFHVRQFSLDLDTDHYLVNAYLYPLFYFLDMGKGDWQINYDGRLELDLEMDNRPIRLIKYLF